MRQCLLGVVAALSVGAAAADAAFVITTQSTATQTLTSPLFGGSVAIAAAGPQVFTLDPATGFADVDSAFTGTDLPDPLTPGVFLAYDLYNTDTIGTLTASGPGVFDVRFELLFELRITSGPLAGVTFETLTRATFESLGVSVPAVAAGTVFADLTPPDDVAVFVKVGVPGVLPVGAAVGASSGRVVTIQSVATPAPPTALLFAAGIAAAGPVGRWSRGR